MSTAKRTEMMNLISTFSGSKNTIPIPRIYVKLTGDYVKAALLNQILYWSERTENPDGWFYKSYVDWDDELCLTQYQVTRAIEGDKRAKLDEAGNKKTLSLRDLGVETMLKKTPKGAPTVHYRIDASIFVPALLACIERDKLDKKSSTKMKQMNIPIINNVDNPIINNVHNGLSTTLTILSTENTTENTNKEKEIATDVAPISNDNSLLNDKSETKQKLTKVEQIALVEALGDAFGIEAKGKDIGLYTKTAKELIEAGINIDEFGAYVRFVREASIEGKWKLSIPSLTSNGRISEYVAKRKTKPSALNGNGASKAIEGRYVDKSSVTSVTPEYRKSYGLPDITESDIPDFLLDETKETT